MLYWGNNSPWGQYCFAANSFIVSGSPSNPILGEVTQRLYLEDELVLQEIFFDYVIEQSQTCG